MSFINLFDSNITFHRRIFYLVEDNLNLKRLIKEYYEDNKGMSLENIIENICTDYDDALNSVDHPKPYSGDLYKKLRNIQNLKL